MLNQKKLETPPARESPTSFKSERGEMGDPTDMETPWRGKERALRGAQRRRKPRTTHIGDVAQRILAGSLIEAGKGPQPQIRPGSNCKKIFKGRDVKETGRCY